MDDPLIFFTGCFCFALAIAGAIMTVIEFKRLEKEDLKKQILDTLEISDNDNVKTRIINNLSQNEFVTNSKNKIRSQWDTYSYFKNILN